MKLKEKFDSIDQSKLNADQKDFLSKIEKATKNFTSDNKEVNDKVEGALDKMIATFKEKMPEAIKTKAEKKEPKASAKKATSKSSEKPSRTNNGKRSVMSVAKEIRKDGESWADAQKRARAEMKKDKESATKEVKTEMEKLLAFIKTRKELEGISGTDLKRDSSREAKPRGRRISKDGNVYYENRENRIDRLAPNYPKDAPMLAGGGAVEEIYFFQCDSKEIRDDFYEDLQAFMPDHYKLKMGDLFIQLNASPNDEEVLQQMANSTDGVFLVVEKYAKGGYVAVTETKDDYWVIVSRPTSKKMAEEMAKIVTTKKDEKNKVVTLEQAKAHKKVLGKEYLDKFELGGNVGGYDLAGHLGGNFNVGQNDGMLDGTTGTQYSGLVGETGAMSAGEMFAEGGYLTDPNFGDFQQMTYAMGGGLSTHGLKEGDQIIKTLSGGIQKVKDKKGEIVYVNLANGERSADIPLPFNDGGEVKYFVNKDGIKVRSVAKPDKELTEKEWMAKHSESKEARTYAGGGSLEDGIKKKLNKNFSLPLEVAVYVPSTKDADESISKKEFESRIKSVEKYLSGLFGGFSANDVDGGYMSQEKGLITEEVYKVISFAQRDGFSSKMEKLVAQIKKWAKDWGQESIGLEFEGDLFYIDQAGEYKLGGMMSKHYSTRTSSHINKGNFNRSLSNRYDNGGEIDAFSMRMVKGTNSKPDEVLTESQEVKFAKGGLITEEKLKEEEWFSPDGKVQFEYIQGRLRITLYYGKNRQYSTRTTINNASELSLKELNEQVKKEISHLKEFAERDLKRNFAGGGKVEKRQAYLDTLAGKESDIWDKLGAESGGEIRQDKDMLRNYALKMEAMLKREEVGKGSFDEADYDHLADMNAHLMNEFLVWNNYYEPEMTVREKKWRTEKLKDPRYKIYVSDPKVITVSESSSSKNSKYIVHADIKSVTVNQKGMKYTFKGSDVLNGVNILEKGNVLETKAIYIPKRDVISVELKDGSEVKPSNGYWIKKDASGELFKPKSENSKINLSTVKTKLGKGVYGNDARTEFENINGYDWQVVTMKRSSGDLVSTAKGGKKEVSSDGRYSTFTYDNESPSIRLVSSKPSRVTEKVVEIQHSNALQVFKEKMESEEVNTYEDGGDLRSDEERVERLMNKLNEDGKLVRFIDVRGNGKKVFESIIENNGKEKTYKRYESSERGKLGVLQNSNLSESDVKHHLEKTLPKYEGGGKVSFAEKSKAIAKNFEGKRVEPKYQKEYGKTYDKAEAKEVGNKIAGAQKAKYDAKAEKGAVVKKKVGNPNAGQSMLLAKKIRKDGEKWTDAVKRASAMLKAKK